MKLLTSVDHIKHLKKGDKVCFVSENGNRPITSRTYNLLLHTAEIKNVIGAGNLTTFSAEETVNGQTKQYTFNIRDVLKGDINLIKGETVFVLDSRKHLITLLRETRGQYYMKDDELGNIKLIVEQKIELYLTTQGSPADIIVKISTPEYEEDKKLKEIERIKTQQKLTETRQELKRIREAQEKQKYCKDDTMNKDTYCTCTTANIGLPVGPSGYTF